MAEVVNVSAEQLEQQVASTLAIADDWQVKGDVRHELSCVTHALDMLLTLAVTYRSSAAEGVAYLRDRRCVELLARQSVLNTQLLTGFRAGARAAAVDNGVTPTHLAWLLDEHALGDANLAIACDPALEKYWPHTKFWSEYHRAMDSLIRGTAAAYVPNVPKPKGYEKHWVPYLDLVAALTSGRDPAPELAACAESFERRNRDKRLTDWKQHDGDGRLPVCWDFRAPSIVARWRAGTR